MKRKANTKRNMALTSSNVVVKRRKWSKRRKENLWRRKLKTHDLFFILRDEVNMTLEKKSIADAEGCCFGVASLKNGEKADIVYV